MLVGFLPEVPLNQTFLDGKYERTLGPTVIIADSKGFATGGHVRPRTHSDCIVRLEENDMR
jgi:hypothetical protein